MKDGIVTWEGQELNHPTTGPDMPNFEPRGCPRGASFSWYIYSPLRVKYPYVRGVFGICGKKNYKITSHH